MSDNPNRHIYERVYTEKNVALNNAKNSYDRWLINFYFSIIEKYGAGKDVMDLCCGTGSLLLPKLYLMKSAVGIDFSSTMLNSLQKGITDSTPANLKLVLGDANYLPLDDNIFDFVYSITSLYHIPNVEKAITETARVLRPGGFAALELGNLNSINTVVTDRYFRDHSWAKSFHIPYKKMQLYLSQAGLKVVEHRCFQITSNYGVPRSLFYLLPVSGRYLKNILGIQFRGRMLDEYISSAWPFKYFAFRHMFICQNQ
ncbi:MAG: class I SAM-dependent methyltransferase [Anaerolineaceae bacterium]